MDTSGFTIRIATRDDAATIAELNGIVQGLHHQVHPDRFLPADADRVVPVFDEWLGTSGRQYGFPSRSETRAWLCQSEDEIPLGYVVAVYLERPETPFTRAVAMIELDQIAVRLEVRTRGIGRALTSAVLAWAQELGVRELQLSLWDFNQSAQQFFSAFGFRPLHRRMHLDIERREV
ncbi:MAG TPA: GNAT family N-acetyltransferase [Acidimicrobiales bacterium]|nr:GNAT family N-acetyltransferase [Acidimicrobiales bacterium]